jgi:hypothetical protein
VVERNSRVWLISYKKLAALGLPEKEQNHTADEDDIKTHFYLL